MVGAALSLAAFNVVAQDSVVDNSVAIQTESMRSEVDKYTVQFEQELQLLKEAVRQACFSAVKDSVVLAASMHKILSAMDLFEERKKDFDAILKSYKVDVQTKTSLSHDMLNLKKYCETWPFFYGGYNKIAVISLFKITGVYVADVEKEMNWKNWIICILITIILGIVLLIGINTADPFGSSAYFGALMVIFLFFDCVVFLGGIFWLVVYWLY